MANVTLRTDWGFFPSSETARFRMTIKGVTGLPRQVASQLSNFRLPALPTVRKTENHARLILDALLRLMPDIEPVKMSGKRYEGTYWPTGIYAPSPYGPGPIGLSADIRYSNGMVGSANLAFSAEKLPSTLLEQVESLDSVVNTHALTWFYTQFGGADIEVTRWVETKIGVFISHRDDTEREARALFEALGEYEKKTRFRPWMDKINMTAGDWLDQVMNNVSKCQAFIPLLSPEFLKGPIATKEFSHAMRLECNKPGRYIVPVSLGGSPSDYGEHFVAIYNIVDASDGLTPETIDKIARLAQGLSVEPSPY